LREARQTRRQPLSDAGRVAWILCGLSLLQCADPFDLLGVEEVVTEHNETDDPLADDELEDKHPEYDPSRTVEEEYEGCRVTLNKSASVTRLSLTDLDGDDSELDGRVFASRTDALDALGSREVIPSMEVVNGALKPFNDGLYAAVELAAEDGSDGAALNKGQLLRDLLAELVARAEGGAPEEQPHAASAASSFAAALQLGGESPEAPSNILSDASAQAAAFRQPSIFSTPIGFYTWLPELEAIFRRDRFLQQPALFGEMAAAALVLGENEDLGARYQAMLDLYAGLTNPFKSDDQLWFSFFHETGHVLLHRGQLFLEVGAKNKSECQADRFAANHLIAPEDFARLAERTRFSKASVKAFADEVGVCPGIVVGRLQHEKRLPPSHLNDLKKRLRWME